MLSAFVGKVYEAITREGGTIIFPSKISKSMPNRLLAFFSFSKTDQELKDLGKKIAKSVADELEVLRLKAETKIGTTEYAKIKTAFEAQLKDYFSTFWVFVPVENNNYAAAYDNADRLLGAVKNARTFTQYPEQGRKCSLSGEQNALVFNGAPLPSFATNVAQIKSDMIDDKEGLSAISFIKRFYPFDSKKKSFDSTTDIALLKSIQEAPKAFQDFEDIFDILKAAEQEKCLKLEGKDWTQFNEQFFYDENLTSKNIPCKQQLEIAQKAHKKLRDALRKKGLKFTKYYAILLFDADSMGAWLSGEYLSDRENKLRDFHKHLSGLLSSFADYAKNYVDGLGADTTKKGRTVYAGGDDYLGFVNLHYLFEVMKHLREQFKAQVSDKISDGRFQITDNKEMTFSAGIAIAHYKTPLTEVLNWARRMEKEAKDTDTKDSFGIAVLKKSGEIHKAVLPFRAMKDGKDIWYSELMREVREGLETHFSSNYITVLQSEMELLAENEDTRIIQIMNFEIERLVLRAKNKATKEEAKEMAKKVMQVYEPNKRNIKNFNASLSICDFINRKLQGND
ncbi:hypothetical protein JCM31826_14870 [Thermaurantimonas aggregans]|uniref:GGDEF domain-containing protein n=3 Tax=Thermaurantimonas aggregans TaxID=2173829 RepID=A0A401XLU8_9FLAO|nr:hypothetical protein JCM31826_14870 [Thermaurantimonas aggregans]